VKEKRTYAVECWHCLAEFDAAQSVWCSCSASRPNKLCPFCLACFCHATETARRDFWEAAPTALVQERETLRDKRMPLGDMLVASNRITSDHLVAALKLQEESGKKLGECLIELGHVEAQEMKTLLGDHQAPVSFNLSRRRINAGLIEQVGIDYCFRHCVVPVAEEDLNGRRMILMAMSDPSDVNTIDHVQSTLETPILPGFAPESSVLGALARLFPARAVALGLAGPEQANPVPRYVDEAIRCRATHLHVDVTPAGSRVTLRVDGILRRLEEIRTPLVPRQLEDWRGPSSLEERSPGVFSLRVDGKRWLLRPSLQRLASATSLAIRIYDPEDVGASLERIVLNGTERLTLREAMGSPTGLVVLSAPPHGASDKTFWGLVNLVLETGRSTLLVGAPLPHPGAGSLPDLSRLPRADVPRLEDPAPAILLYASPSGSDIGAALDAARRHLVVLRLEASDGPRALARLAASAPDVMAPAGILRLLVAQISMRRICDHCFTPAGIQPDEFRRLGLSASECLGLKVYRGAGCEYCAPSPGYRGREIALELVPSTPALEDLFLTGRLPDATSALPRPAGLRTLRRACLDLVDRGVTTLEEFRKLGLADRSTVPGSAGHLPAPISPGGPRNGAPGRRRDTGR